MTTFRGAMRSYNAAVNRAGRIQQKHNREAAKRYKLQQKMEMIQNAAQAETDWKSYVNMLKSIHKDHSEEINWIEIVNEPIPVEPIKENKNEEMAQIQIDYFEPSFFDKLFGLTGKRIKSLNIKLEEAITKDLYEYQSKLDDYHIALEEWNRLQSISKGVIKKDVNSYKDTLEYFKPFEDIIHLGKQIRFILNKDYIDVELDTLSEGIIPEFELNLTSTGKLTKKDMSISKFNDLYFEHISSCIIRIAKEVTIYFPITYIAITVVSKDLNKATGNYQSNIILSILTTANKINELNLNTLSPIDTIKSFKNNIKYTKTNGFSAVPKISVENTLLSN